VSAKLRFHVITVFPEMITQALSYGVVAQAVKSGLLEFKAVTPRSFTNNVHQTVDDRPFGGGDGMVMLAEPLALALESIRAQLRSAARVRAVHLSPRGKKLNDQRVRALAGEYTDIILVASRYAGVDQRFLNTFIDEEISIGDFIVSGGELPLLVLIDAISRQVPGVLGNDVSSEDESFSPSHGGGLEFPQFTRPREWRGHAVPNELVSGDHARVGQWKSALSILVTAENRPDLLSDFRSDELILAEKLLHQISMQEMRECGLHDRSQLLMRLRSHLR
jgi:tRNA (guanine37-N1)-methyltransferase